MRARAHLKGIWWCSAMYSQKFQPHVFWYFHLLSSYSTIYAVKIFSNYGSFILTRNRLRIQQVDCHGQIKEHRVDQHWIWTKVMVLDFWYFDFPSIYQIMGPIDQIDISLAQPSEGLIRFERHLMMFSNVFPDFSTTRFLIFSFAVQLFNHLCCQNIFKLWVVHPNTK